MTKPELISLLRNATLLATSDDLRLWAVPGGRFFEVDAGRTPARACWVTADYAARVIALVAEVEVRAE